jgi:glutamine amidotransferase
MCELLGMACNVPTDIAFSFAGLALRGGMKGPHADGWGLGLYEGRAARVFLEPRAASESPLAAFVRDNPIKTLQAVAHIRKRTRGPVCLANTHPFVRELWGRHWVFAHNGTVKRRRSVTLGRYRPIGSTDSEWAFCALLGRLDAHFSDSPRRTRALHQYLADVADELGQDGTFNFLLGNGEQLFAHCATKLHYVERRAPFSRATLADDDVSVDFAKLTTPEDRVAIVATAPLTRDETWTAAVPGDLWVFQDGQRVATLRARRAASAPSRSTPQRRSRRFQGGSEHPRKAG